mgnify:FL=1
MNSTTSNVVMTGEGYGYATIILGVLFVLSELLPFVKKT